MNQSIPNDPNQNQFQAQPQPQSQPQSQPQQLNTPFEVAPAGQPPMTPPGQNVGNQPNGMEPMPIKGKSSLWLIIALVVILFIGVMVIANWQGWIKISSLWKKETPAVTTTAIPEVAVNANDRLRKTALAQLKAALKSYYQATQTYPIAATVQKTSDPSNVLTVLVPTYIATLPVDPSSPTFYYGYKSDGSTFELTAVLEDNTDTSGTLTGSYNIYKITETSVETPSASSETTTDTSAATPSATPDATGSTVTDTSASSSSTSATGDTSASSSATAGQ